MLDRNNIGYGIIMVVHKKALPFGQCFPYLLNDLQHCHRTDAVQAGTLTQCTSLFVNRKYAHIIAILIGTEQEFSIR